MTQMSLPVDEVKTLCGYCGHRLVAVLRRLRNVDVPVTLYECARCAPLLRAIQTPSEWNQFLREAMKEKAS